MQNCSYNSTILIIKIFSLDLISNNKENENQN